MIMTFRRDGGFSFMGNSSTTYCFKYSENTTQIIKEKKKKERKRKEHHQINSKKRRDGGATGCLGS